MKFICLYMAYLGYVEKEKIMNIKAFSLEGAKKKALKEIDKLNASHRGYYKILEVKEAE